MQQAVSWALSRYNADQSFRATTVEIGSVMSIDPATGLIRPGPDVFGPNNAEVEPYGAGGLVRLIELLSSGTSVFGDFHCHVALGLSWTDHVPSPADVVAHSCLCDLWETPGYEFEGHAIESIPLSPRFQLMQSCLFGDVFVICPKTSRSSFRNLAEQRAAMAAIEEVYGNWHLRTHIARGDLQLPVGHREFVASVRAELPRMNSALGARGTIRFVANRGYRSDDPDFLA